MKWPPGLSTAEGWLYLAVIMDLASRRIIGWSMSDRLRADLVCQALRAAYWRRKPAPGLIMHSDRGSQYASGRHRQLLADYGMLQSMSRRANCWDNSPMESFFKTLKVERVHQLRYETRGQARLDIVDWVEGLYNHCACIRRSDIRPWHTRNAASWLRGLVYVKSRQGHLGDALITTVATSLVRKELANLSNRDHQRLREVLAKLIG